MKNNEQLNNLVLNYRRTHNEETFEQIYAEVSESWRSLETVGKSIRASGDEVLAAYEDVLMECIDKYNGLTDFKFLLSKSLRYRRRDIYQKKKRLNKLEVFLAPVENDDGSEVAFEIEDESADVEKQVIAKKKADQRQLIDLLLSDADAKTTAIVEAFLKSEKPTPTAIGEALGLHHSTVIRSLKRLAAKFDSKQYGDYTDYLVAL